VWAGVIAARGSCAGPRRLGAHGSDGQHSCRGRAAVHRGCRAHQKREEAGVDCRQRNVDEQSRHPSDELQHLAGAGYIAQSLVRGARNRAAVGACAARNVHGRTEAQ